MSEDYCKKCGCPKDVCCGQGKVSLEWLNRHCADTRKKIWQHGTKSFIDVNDLLLAAKKEGKKNEK